MKLAVSAAVLVVVLASVWLGSWQWDRYEAKAERKDRVEQHYSADPVPVTEVLTSEPVPLAREWTRVEARGEYLPDDLLVRNRPRDGVYGYEVLRRLALEDGSVLVVDRGWVPNSPQGATVRPDVPTPPSGSVTVTGWVKLGEPSLDRDPIEGQLSSINLQEAAAEWGGTSLLGGFGSVWGTLVGAIIMIVIRNGLNLLNVSSNLQKLVIGVVILLAVLADAIRMKTAKK